MKNPKKYSKNCLRILDRLELYSSGDVAAGAAASNRQAKKQASLMATASVGCLRNAAKEDARRLSLGKDSLKHAKGVRCCSAYHANIHKSPGAVSPKREDRVSFSELV